MKSLLKILLENNDIEYIDSGQHVIFKFNGLTTIYDDSTKSCSIKSKKFDINTLIDKITK